MMQTARKGSESMFAHADYLRCFGAMTLCDGVSANFLATLDKAELDRFVEILSMFVWYARPQSKRLLAVEDGRLSIDLLYGLVSEQ